MEEYFADNESVNIMYLFGITMASKNVERMKAKNDSLFAMSKRDARFIPVCSVHPSETEAAIEELHRIKGLGGKIIKLHPMAQNFSVLDEKTLLVVRTAGELGLVILIDGMGNLDPLIELAIVCSNTKIIIAHMGVSDFHKLVGFNLFRKAVPDAFKYLFFDISVIAYLYADSPYQTQ
jgi:predicted TIM-barrel fold metal-dependent hydrolase